MNTDFTDDAAFRTAVGALLRSLIDQMDEIDSEAHDPMLTEGNIKIVFESGSTFVLSQQTPMHELWLSANLTAWHFRREAGQWQERDSGVPMLDVLSDLFSDKLSMPVRFSV
jgi:iron donor protein CyaY